MKHYSVSTDISQICFSSVAFESNFADIISLAFNIAHLVKIVAIANTMLCVLAKKLFCPKLVIIRRKQSRDGTYRIFSKLLSARGDMVSMKVNWTHHFIGLLLWLRCDR